MILVFVQSCRESKHMKGEHSFCARPNRDHEQETPPHVEGCLNQSEEENSNCFLIQCVIAFKISSAMHLLSQRENGGGPQISSLNFEFWKNQYEVQMTQNYARKFTLK